MNFSLRGVGPMGTLAALLLTVAPCAAAEVATEHYDLLAEGIDPADTGRLLEALHAELASYFGAAPEGRLRVEVHASHERFRAAMLADGETPPEAGGYYSPGTRKAYLWVQPSEYFTRQLLLHEATHQFHILFAASNRTPAATWYVEGLAEFFGMHDWDGETLHTGVVPPVTLEDYPAKALEQLDAAEGDLEGIVSCRVGVDRPLAWALIHFLSHTHADGFRALAADLDGRRDAGEAFARAIGAPSAELAAELRSWIESHQQPWRVLWVGWQGRGEAIEGASTTNALALLKSGATRLEAEIGGTHVWAGLAFGVASVDEFWLVQAGLEGRARVVRRSKGTWHQEAERRVEADGPRRVSIRRDGDRVEAFVDGVSLGTFEAPGGVGLNVDSGRARFLVNREE